MEPIPTDTIGSQQQSGGLDLGQGVILNMGQKLYLFLTEEERENRAPAAEAIVESDGLYMNGKRIEPSRGSVLQPAMKIIQEQRDHRNSRGEIVSLSAWRQWCVMQDDQFVRIFDLKDPSLALRRRSR